MSDTTKGWRSSKNPYVNSAAPHNRDLFFYQDLNNPRMTWRLYSQSAGGGLKGPLLTGFYLNNSQFSVNHSYSSGMGDDIETAIKSKLLDGARGIVRKSRDLYNLRGEVEKFKDKAVDAISDAAGWLGGSIGDLGSMMGFDGVADSAEILTDMAQRGLAAAREFDISKAMEDTLKRSKSVTQGMQSKLYEESSISIPAISNLSCIIYSTPGKSCIDEIRNLTDSVFLGKFEFFDGLGKGKGGQWIAPNGLDLGSDNPLTTQRVPGAFTLRAGPYVFKNLLLKSFTWEFSKEYMAIPSTDDRDSNKINIPKVTNMPMYAKCTVDLDNYKYKTREYLDSTYMPDSGIKGVGDVDIDNLEVEDSKSRYNYNKPNKNV